MNKNVARGNEMNSAEMRIGALVPGKSQQAAGLVKSWAVLIGVMLICASAQVAAGVCDAELQRLTTAQRELLALGAKPQTISNVTEDINMRIISRHDFSQYCGAPCDVFSRGITPSSPNYGDALRASARIYVSRAETWGRRDHDYFQFLLYECVARHMAAEFDAKHVKSSSSTNRPPPSATTNATPSANTNQETQRLNAQLNEAMARAEKRQADVDRARQGKPKRHVLGAEAHNCLKPQRGGGVINECPYAVEYDYCVLRPEKDSWSASFDCEKGKFGSWQIGPGPNNRSIMHTAGLTTYWFACRYGETLHKPDGISPADIEFQLGRGLLGRCAEWGSGGK